jgi:hypothetical protein
MWAWDFHSGTKKPVMSKRKFLLHGTLKTFSKFTTQTSKSKKENQSFFRATILCFPDLFAADMLYLLLT